MKKLFTVSFGIIILISQLLAQKPGDKKIFSLNKNVKIEMVWIPGGDFIMGSPSSDNERYAEREVQHQVIITNGFWMATTETTQKMWEQLTNSNPSKIMGSNLPVEQVNWNEIQIVLKKIHLTDNKFRLPTEAEWEYACRAGTTSPYAGNRDAMTWHSENADRTTHRVASKNPNAWGLYDMHGNVSEWCSDWFTASIGTNAINPPGPKNGERRVQRGGQYTGRVKHTRSSDRSSDEPNLKSFFVGFRFARSE